MRNTKAFKEAVGGTLAALARRGVTIRPGTVEDVIERNMTEVAGRLGIQVRSAWRYFDAERLAESLASRRREFEDRQEPQRAGRSPMPPVDNPELALLLAGVPDALAESGGDLYGVLLNVVVNAWMAGHIHGEDGCPGCDGNRGRAGRVSEGAGVDGTAHPGTSFAAEVRAAWEGCAMDGPTWPQEVRRLGEQVLAVLLEAGLPAYSSRPRGTVPARACSWPWKAPGSLWG